MRRTAMGLMLVVATLALIAGCSSTPSNESITTDIKAKLFSDPQTKTSNVDVAANNGTVTLTGQVADDNTRYEAFKLASEAKGVSKVNDQMTVQPTQSVAAAAAVEPPTPAVEPAPASRKKHRDDDHADLPRRDLAHDSARQDPAPLPQAPPPSSPSPSDVAAAAPVAPPPPPPPQPRQVEIPAGTSVRVQMIDGVDSSVNKAGQMFRASLDTPIVFNNDVVIPAGTDIFVKLVDQSSAGHIAGKSQLTLQLNHVDFQGTSYPLNTTVYTQVGTSRGTRSAETIGGGAALGALLGAALGHSKGAAIGAAAGAAGGTAVEAATKGQQVRIPAETKLDFKLDQPLDISYFPDRNPQR